MLYPIVLTCVCLGIVTLMMVYVVPEGHRGVRVEQGQAAARDRDPDLRQQLPAQFRHLLLVIGIVAAIVGFIYWLKNTDNRRRFHRFQLRVPLFGRLVRGFNTARFTRTFSILTASAVPVLEAHAHRRRGRHQSTDARRRDRRRPARARRRADRALAATSRLFPPMTVHLISWANRAASSTRCSNAPPRTRNASWTR